MIFTTIDEAETYFWEKLAKNNEDFAGLESFLEDNAAQIKDDEALKVEAARLSANPN